MKFHLLARGIMFSNHKVLLAQHKGADNIFLPGGHIRLGEKAEAALIREIEEEIGQKAIVKQFIGAVETTWADDGKDNHEIDLLFEVDIPTIDSSESPSSREAQLEFMWIEPVELTSHNLLPKPMVECLLNWQRGYHGYWGSSID